MRSDDSVTAGRRWFARHLSEPWAAKRSRRLRALPQAGSPLFGVVLALVLSGLLDTFVFTPVSVPGQPPQWRKGSLFGRGNTFDLHLQLQPGQTKGSTPCPD
jgi:hypothetical protein